jgi:hypothetical protein
VTRPTAPDVTGNRLLAARARDLGRTVAAARKLLGEIGPADVRVRAGQLLAELAAPETAS